jgi:hypothetical protein
MQVEKPRLVPGELKQNQLPTYSGGQTVESEGGVHCLRGRRKGCPGQLSSLTIFGLFY